MLYVPSWKPETVLCFGWSDTGSAAGAASGIFLFIWRTKKSHAKREIEITTTHVQYTVRVYLKDFNQKDKIME